MHDDREVRREQPGEVARGARGEVCAPAGLAQHPAAPAGEQSSPVQGVVPALRVVLGLGRGRGVRQHRPDPLRAGLGRPLQPIELSLRQPEVPEHLRRGGLRGGARGPHGLPRNPLAGLPRPPLPAAPLLLGGPRAALAPPRGPHARAPPRLLWALPALPPPSPLPACLTPAGASGGVRPSCPLWPSFRRGPGESRGSSGLGGARAGGRARRRAGGERAQKPWCEEATAAASRGLLGGGAGGERGSRGAPQAGGCGDLLGALGAPPPTRPPTCGASRAAGGPCPARRWS